jgi:hypothetical protein
MIALRTAKAVVLINICNFNQKLLRADGIPPHRQAVNLGCNRVKPLYYL